MGDRAQGPGYLKTATRRAILSAPEPGPTTPRATARKTCPTGWGLSPIEALAWLEDNLIPYFPLGEFKTPEDT